MNATTVRNILWEKQLQKAHLKSFGHSWYNFSFENQSFITFEEDFCYEKNIPFVAYCGFEISTTKTGHADTEIDEMYHVSDDLIFAIASTLKLDRITVQGGFGHFLTQLYNVSYLSRDIVSLIDISTARQLEKVAIKLSKGNVKQSISKLFSTELKRKDGCLWTYHNRIIKQIEIFDCLKFEYEKKIR